MAQKLQAAMPEGLVVGDGFVLQFRAVDPTTGDDVSGVVVTNVNIDGDDAGSGNVKVGNPVLIGINV